LIDNSKSFFDAVGKMRKIYSMGRCVAAQVSLDLAEKQAIQLLSDWYISQKIGDRNPFEVDFGEMSAPNARNYANNYADTVRIRYYHAGRKHAVHWHVSSDTASSLVAGSALDFDTQESLFNLLFVNFGFTDFTILDWSVRVEGTEVWLPVPSQASFAPTPGTLTLATYTGLSSSGYARFEGLSIDSNGLGVRGFFSIQGLCFPPSQQTLTDARLTGDELPGLPALITALNTENEGSVGIMSACGERLRWKNYINLGFSALARKAARRG